MKKYLCILLIIATVIPLCITVSATDGVVTTFSELQSAISAASGTEDNPALIRISGMIEQTEGLRIKNGQYIRLVGVGTGENGLIRKNAFADNMIDVGDYSDESVCTLTLDNIILDGGAVWKNGAGSTNSGISVGNYSAAVVRDKAKLVLDNNSVVRNHEKTGGHGGAAYIRGAMEIIDGCIMNNSAKNNNGGGVCLRLDSSKLTLRENAVISGNYANDGGGIYMYSGGTLVMEGAKINNNTTASGFSGGGVYVKGSATVSVNSGEIKGNTSTNGSAIYVANSNTSHYTINLFNCDISENVSTGTGAVWVTSNVGILKLGGSVCIVDNTDANGKGNLYINSSDGLSERIKIAQPFTAEANVGLSFNGEALDGLLLAKKSDKFLGEFDLNAIRLDTPSEKLKPMIYGDVIMLYDITTAGCNCGGKGELEIGNGTSTSPYLITSAEQLRHIEKHPDAHYSLANSIDLSMISSWTPLCSDVPFSGNFNGNGKTIGGMNVNEGSLGGLFSRISKEATVYDLTVTGVLSVGESMTQAGGLAAVSYGTLKQITSNVNITVSNSAEANVGGIVGYNGGTVTFSSYNGKATGEIRRGESNVGAIIGCSTITEPSPLLPTIITAHTGFGAAEDSGTLKIDNTIDNIIHSVNYGPDNIEVDVCGYDADGNGIITTDELRISHNASDAKNGDKLSDVLKLLAGTHRRSSEMNSDYADSVCIQLDIKQEAVLTTVLDLIDEMDFPYSRVCLAGDLPYSTVENNIVKIKAAVAKGMDFWMNPNFILSYDAMVNQTDEFIAKIKALGISPFTVNSNHEYVTEAIQKKLNDAGINLSVWTLNSIETINSNILTGKYNITTRMQESLVIREQILNYGTLANTFSRTLHLPEVAALGLPYTDDDTDKKDPDVEEESTGNTPSESEPSETTEAVGSTDDTENTVQSKNGSSVGTIVAIVAASVCVVAATIVAVVLAFKKRG